MSGGGAMVTAVEVENVLGEYADGYSRHYYDTGERWVRLTLLGGRTEIWHGRVPDGGAEHVYEPHSWQKHGPPPRAWQARIHAA